MDQRLIHNYLIKERSQEIYVYQLKSHQPIPSIFQYIKTMALEFLQIPVRFSYQSCNQKLTIDKGPLNGQSSTYLAAGALFAPPLGFIPLALSSSGFGGISLITGC